MTLKTRNRAIAQAHFFGATRDALALRFGLTPRRISQIVAEERLSQTLSRRDAFRALKARKPGRPRDTRLDAVRGDPYYAKLRRIMGAAYARQVMGIAA